MRMLSCFSRAQLFVTLWTVARQASLPMGFSRQEYWSGLPFPSPGDLPHPGIKPRSPTSALAGGFFTTGFPGGSAGKESTCNEGDLGSIPGLVRSQEEGMATHSSVLAWRSPMDREAWWTTYSPWGHKESDTTSN